MAEEDIKQPEPPKEPRSVVGFRREMPTVDLQETEIDPTALLMIPQEIAAQHNVLPLYMEDDTLVVASEFPDDYQLIDTLSLLTNKKIKILIPVQQNLREHIEANYQTSEGGQVEEAIQDIIAPVKQTSEAEVIQELAEAASDAPIVKAVNMILTQAIKERASDIHIAPEETCLKVRYRTDGVLHDSMSLPSTVQSAIITRLKILANMNISERRRPQDGAFTETISNKEIDFRVATIGTIWGEACVMRVLDKSFNLVELESIGMPAAS